MGAGSADGRRRRWIVVAWMVGTVWVLSCSKAVNYEPPEGGTEVAITHFSFGKMIVDGQTLENDIVIFTDGSVRHWHRRIHHAIRLSDLSDLLREPIHTLIIGVGTDRKCAVADEVRTVAADRGIVLKILDTYEAVKVFNASEKTGLAACFHVTC